MGMDDRDGAYRSRGQSARRRPYDHENDARDMSGPRSRPPRRDYDDADYARAARDPRSSARGGPSSRNDRDDYDRRSSGNSSSGSRRRYEGGGDYPNRPSRADGYDRSGRASRSDPGAAYPRGERPMRDGRPPMRDNGWDDPRGGRSGGRAANPADSNGRMRRAAPQGRGGLWDDQPSTAMSARDARARYLQNQQDGDDEEEGGSFAVGAVKALGAIILALVLGVGAAYGYSLVSAPHLSVPADQQITPTAPASTPSTTPSASPSPSATKSAELQPASGAPYILVS